MKKEKKKEVKFTREWFVEQGRSGGLKTRDLYGRTHFAKIRKSKVDNSKKVAETVVK